MEITRDALAQRLKIPAPLDAAAGEDDEDKNKDPGHPAGHVSDPVGHRSIDKIEAAFLLLEPASHKPVAFDQFGEPGLVGNEIATATVSIDEIIGRPVPDHEGVHRGDGPAGRDIPYPRVDDHFSEVERDPGRGFIALNRDPDVTTITVLHRNDEGVRTDHADLGRVEMPREFRLAKVGRFGYLDLHRVGKTHRRVGYRRGRIGKNNLNLVDRHRLTEINLNPALHCGFFGPGPEAESGALDLPVRNPQRGDTVAKKLLRPLIGPLFAVERGDPFSHREVAPPFQNHNLAERKDLLPARLGTPQPGGSDSNISP